MLLANYTFCNITVITCNYYVLTSTVYDWHELAGVSLWILPERRHFEFWWQKIFAYQYWSVTSSKALHIPTLNEIAYLNTCYMNVSHQRDLCILMPDYTILFFASFSTTPNKLLYMCDMVYKYVTVLSAIFPPTSLFFWT